MFYKIRFSYILFIINYLPMENIEIAYDLEENQQSEWNSHIYEHVRNLLEVLLPTNSSLFKNKREDIIKDKKNVPSFSSTKLDVTVISTDGAPIVVQYKRVKNER